jgi:hypothetical protein
MKAWLLRGWALVPRALVGVLLSAVGLLGCLASRESVTAGQVGCSPSEIQISNQDSSVGWIESSDTWTAQCNGRTYVCSEVTTRINHGGSSQVSCQEQGGASERALPPAPKAAADAPARSTAPPTAGAGFALGADSETLQKTCEAAGNTWHLLDPNNATCSGAAVDLGFPSTVSLAFCKDKACSLTLQYRPESRWLASITELKTKLRDRYGEPKESSSAIPTGCRSDAEFANCLEIRNLRLRFGWGWDSGERLYLTVGKPVQGDGEPAIRIQYTRPASRLSVPASAL